MAPQTEIHLNNKIIMSKVSLKKGRKSGKLVSNGLVGRVFGEKRVLQNRHQVAMGVLLGVFSLAIFGSWSWSFQNCVQGADIPKITDCGGSGVTQIWRRIQFITAKRLDSSVQNVPDKTT